MRSEKKQWLAQGHAHSNSGVGFKQDSRVGYYAQNKENQFKEQMLKLTIFQKHALDHSETEISPRSNYNPQPLTNNSDNSSYERQRATVTNHRKKAEFEKKIKKFIESDSPYHSVEQSNQPLAHLDMEECSFGHEAVPVVPRHHHQHQMVESPASDKDTFEENMW